MLEKLCFDELCTSIAVTRYCVISWYVTVNTVTYDAAAAAAAADDDDDDDELFLWYGWPTRGVYLYFQPGPLSEILTVVNLRRTVGRAWTCAEPDFRLSWMKLCSKDKHYTTVATKTIACIQSFMYNHHKWKPLSSIK